MCRMKEIWTIFVGVILFSCCNQPSESLRILGLFPINSKSHFAMFETLAKYLASKGHQIDVYSQYPLKKSIPNYKDFSLEGSLPASHNNLTYVEAMSFEPLDVQTIINFVGTPVCTIMNHPKVQQLLKNPPQDPPYDIVIVEAFLSNCHLSWGRHLNIPMVALMSTPMLDWYHPSMGNPTSPIWAVEFGSLGFFERVIRVGIYTKFRLMFKSFLREQEKFITDNFGAHYPDLMELQKDIDLLLVNTHHSLEGMKPYNPAVVPVAGLHIKNQLNEKLPQDVQKWLDDSTNGCIYFSFGSMVRIETFPKSILNEIYSTFKKIAPVRVLMKIAKPNDLPLGLPSNVMTQPWLSQELVLNHKNVKLFITHGGLMGTLESIYYAVPMIGIPIFGDQRQNVETYVQKGISAKIEITNITEHTLTSNIFEMLHNPVYKKNSDKLSKLFTDRPMKPIETATYWIEYVARHGKNALRSPLVDMPWWKALFIDVYALGFAILSLFTLLLKLLWKLIKSIISHAKPQKNTSQSYSHLKESKKLQ